MPKNPANLMRQRAFFILVEWRERNTLELNKPAILAAALVNTGREDLSEYYDLPVPQNISHTANGVEPMEKEAHIQPINNPGIDDKLELPKWNGLDASYQDLPPPSLSYRNQYRKEMEVK